MKTVLFVDTTHPEAYDFSTQEFQAVGGTESSLLRTAKILAENGFQVTVYQQARTKSQHKQQGVLFIGLGDLQNIVELDHIVILRKFKQINLFRQRFPTASIYLWIHTYKNIEYSLKRLASAKLNYSIVCNSKTHADHTNGLLNESIAGRLFSLIKPRTEVYYCYNPIPQSLQQTTDKKRDINKLLFLSSPNKGLDQVIQCFKAINQVMPELKLYIANPGYRADAELDGENIVALGPLPHRQIMQHIASSLCVFYPQDSFAETFGLIYAEANAMGTPVIAHDIGAAKEILHHHNSLIQANNHQLIIETLRKWQKNPPAVGYKQAFNKPAVFRQWQSVFSD
ncbi:MAG: glycosyltransferase family 4 protein [Proteobacteria bacterium]|nr:glycosyltransferase family 4 protein [Pseudomonadota bacterium]